MRVLNVLATSRRAAAFVVAAVTLFANGCDRSPSIVSVNPAPMPASVEALTNTAVTGVAAAMISPAPQVVVRDASGRPLADVLVRWSVVSGGGTVANSTSRTNGSGVASSGAWTLGTSAGTQELEALVNAVGSVRFVAQVTAPPRIPANIVIVSGNSQQGASGAVLPLPLTVRVTDQTGNPVAGATVVASPDTNSGSISPPITTTSSNGIATFIMDTGIGRHTIRHDQCARYITGSAVHRNAHDGQLHDRSALCGLHT